MKNIIYILLTLLLSSCFYEAVYNFDKEDLAWMEPYDKRDTIIFASEEGMDTMRGLLFIMRMVTFRMSCFMTRRILSANL